MCKRLLRRCVSALVRSPPRIPRPFAPAKVRHFFDLHKETAFFIYKQISFTLFRLQKRGHTRINLSQPPPEIPETVIGDL